jgi:hypothetical protein
MDTTKPPLTKERREQKCASMQHFREIVANGCQNPDMDRSTCQTILREVDQEIRRLSTLTTPNKS